MRLLPAGATGAGSVTFGALISCEATGEELVAGWGHPVPLLGLAGNPTWRFAGVRVSLVENRFVGGSQCPSVVGRF
jgi:hypothetical protein